MKNEKHVESKFRDEDDFGFNPYGSGPAPIRRRDICDKSRNPRFNEGRSEE